MTITSTPSEISYAGDGVTTVFSVPFVFDTAADLKIIRTNADGSLQVLITGFTVSGGNGATGSVTFSAAPAADVDITILDNPEVKQSTDYVTNDAFPAESHERALDRLTRICKRLSRLILRTARVDDGDPASGSAMVFPAIADRRGKFAFWADDSTAALEPAVGLPIGEPLSSSIIADLLFPYDGDIVNGTLTPTATARFYATEEIEDHAHYGFLDESLIDYAGGAPIYGHASFDDNVTFTGNVASDHHHSFQSVTHYDNSGTINRIASFYSFSDITAGTVLSCAGLWVEDPLGAGTIINLYGVYIAPLDRGTGNSYAFFSEGQTKSCLGGPLQLGNPGLPATIQYNYATGNLDLIPRADAGNAYNIFANSEYLYIGDGNIGTAASIRNSTAGDLEITARTGFVTKMKSPTQVEHPLKFPAYTVAQLGSAVLPGDWTDCMCICSNESGGRTPVFSDGTNWRRVADRAVIS